MVAVTLGLLLSLLSVDGYLNISVSKVGYSYSVDTVIDSTPFPTVVDTGSYLLVTRNVSDLIQFNLTAYCLFLTVDGTSAQYAETISSRCRANQNITSIGAASASVEVTESDVLVLQNPVLHDWLNTTAGDLGMGYQCNDGQCSATPFQSILSTADPGSTANQTFGLDLRDPNSTIASISAEPSSMQMAGVSTIFASTITWQDQAITTPTYHQAFIEDVNFCGAQLLGNFSSNWQVLFDTGASCLTLPGEVYDSFDAWLASGYQVDSWSDLPALSFRLLGGAEQLLLPLGALVLDADAIITESGAPTVTSKQQGTARLCVLRGTDIVNSFGDYTSPTPMIVFGSMALRPFYFAANFAQFSVGLATKLSGSEISYYSRPASSNPSCQVPTNCTGRQNYEPTANVCSAPNCKQYYFQQLDSSGTECEYKLGALNFGIFFVSLIAVMEVCSYFMMQYTAHTLIERRVVRSDTLSVDWLAYHAGRLVSGVFDCLMRCCLVDSHPPPRAPGEVRMQLLDERPMEENQRRAFV